MISVPRLIGRLLFGLLLAVFVLILVGLVKFTQWRDEKMVSLRNGSEVLETSSGDVEYAQQGAGPAVLIFHGAPGGYDQALVVGEDLEKAGFRVVAPSRPGYLRTPLESGILPEQQADSIRRVINGLGIESVAVVGVSEGALSAIAFVLRHPEKARGLVLVSGQTNRLPIWGPNIPPWAGKQVLRDLTGDIGSWLAGAVMKRDPRRILEAAAAWDNSGTPEQRHEAVNAVLASPSQLNWLTKWVESYAPLSPREVGTRNDLVNAYNYQVFAYGKITVPTLFIHGSLDQCIPLKDAEALAAKIPGAKVEVVKGMGHLMTLGSEQGRTRMVDFLKSLPVPTPSEE